MVWWAWCSVPCSVVCNDYKWWEARNRGSRVRYLLCLLLQLEPTLEPQHTPNTSEQPPLHENNVMSFSQIHKFFQNLMYLSGESSGKKARRRLGIKGNGRGAITSWGGSSDRHRYLGPQELRQDHLTYGVHVRAIRMERRKKYRMTRLKVLCCISEDEDTLDNMF